MRHMLIIALLLLAAGCGKQEQKTNEEQSGNVTAGVSSEIISADMGYIVENARLTEGDEQAEYSVKGMMKLSSGPGSVMILRTQSTDGSFTEMLAIAMPAFAAGTVLDLTAGSPDAGFWIFGMKGDQDVMKETGMIEGSLTMLKTEPADDALGLSRDVMNAVGEIEVVVTGIDNEGLPVEAEKKYAARFRLPIITLDELARINQPI
ncbi:hypothetical protein KQI65_13100 [bacterium]|nr:hypothetical protein [bacterium]